MVSIDYDKCDMCWACTIPGTTCFIKKDNNIVVPKGGCILCGRCISVCPKDAIINYKLDMDKFENIETPMNYKTEEFVQFIRERRSHKSFSNKEVTKEVLEKLLDATRYSPTASNSQDVEVIVIQNPETIKKLSIYTTEFYEIRANNLKKMLEENPNLEDVKGHVPIKKRIFYGKYLKYTRDHNIDAIFYNAPVLLVFHSNAESCITKDNCVIACNITSMVARTMGLESTYMGLFELAAETYNSINEELNIPSHHQIYSAMILGYPKVKFLKTVYRKPVKIEWVK